MGRYPTRFQTKTMWSAATGVAILILGCLLVGLVWLTSKTLAYLQPVLVPLAVAGIIAYLLDPVVRWLERRRMSRLWAVVTVLSAMLLATLILIATILPAVHQGRAMISRVISGSPTAASPDTQDHRLSVQVADFLRKARRDHARDPIGWLLEESHPSPAPPAADTPPPDSSTAVPPAADASVLDFFWRTRLGKVMVEYKDELFALGRRWLSAGTDKVFGFLGLAIGFLLVPVYLFFFLKDSAAIREHWHDYVPLKASRFKTELVDTLQEINGYLVSFFRGQVLVAFIDGILVGLALTFYGLPYGFLIGVFMAALGVIPYLGSILCLIPACIIGYFYAAASSPFGLQPGGYVIGILVIFVVVQKINSLVTAPKIVGDSVGLHPMTVIFSMLFWSLVLGGFFGALVAVPLTAAIKVLFRRYIWERQMLQPAAAEPVTENE